MELILLVIGLVQRIVNLLLRPIYYLISLQDVPKLPPINSPYLEMSATAIARKIRQREVKSRDIVDACIERIKAVNPILNAVVQDRFKDAQEEADRVDYFIETEFKNLENLEKEKPFLGVPFTVKESCGLKGMSQAVGCVPRSGIICAEDGAAVKELRKAGGIPLAISNTPELGYCWESINLITGCTRNPYNYHRSAGGSSGGEGALLGAGASFFGVGSDLGGSIRVPAMFNGIFGHKPTPGYVSLDGHYPNSSDKNLQKYLVIGPLARHAEDLPTLLKVLCGNRGEQLNLDEKVDIGKLNIYFIEDSGHSLVTVPVVKEIKERMRSAVSYLKAIYGCKIEQSNFEELADSIEFSGKLILNIDVPNLLGFSKKKNYEDMNIYIETLKSFLGLSEFSIFGTLFTLNKHVLSKKDCENYLKRNEDLKRKIMAILNDNGVLLYPTFPKPAINHYEIVSLTCAAMYPIIVNTLELPATHVPLGLDKNGLPIGIQVIAGPNQDRLCFAVAKVLEERFGGWVPPS